MQSIPKSDVLCSRPNSSQWSQLSEPLILALIELPQFGRLESATFRIVCRQWKKVHDSLLTNVQIGGDFSRACHFLGQGLFPRLRSVDLSCCHQSAMTLGPQGLHVPQSFGRHLRAMMGDQKYKLLRIRDADVIRTETNDTADHNDVCAFALKNPTLECRNAMEDLRKNSAALYLLRESILDEYSEAMEEGVKNLSSLPELSTLSLPYRCKITLRVACALAKISTLSSLDLASCENVNDDVLQVLATIPCLQFLDLTNCDQVTDKGVAFLANLSSLQTLRLGLVHRLTDTGLKHLAEMSTLKSLDLGGCWSVTNTGLLSLSVLPAIHTMELTGCFQISDDGVSALARVSTLQTLDLADCCHVGDDSLRAISSLPELTSLYLRECSVTDAGIKMLAGLSTLRVLDVSNCDEVTYLGVSALSRVSVIRELDLSIAMGLRDEEY